MQFVTWFATNRITIKNIVSSDFWSAFVYCKERFRLPPTRCEPDPPLCSIKFLLNKRNMQFYFIASSEFNAYQMWINRGYLLFWGEYQVYFIECGEKISIFHECVVTHEICIFRFTRWNKWHIHSKNLNILYLFIHFFLFIYTIFKEVYTFSWNSHSTKWPSITKL